MPSLSHGGNESFITLIPKTSDPLSLNEYHLIHLMECIGKVVSKVLAERMKKVMDAIVSNEQSAFVKGRNILDGPLIVNEVLSWAKRTRKKLFLLKVDLEKAFDNINW